MGGTKTSPQLQINGGWLILICGGGGDRTQRKLLSLTSCPLASQVVN